MKPLTLKQQKERIKKNILQAPWFVITLSIISAFISAWLLYLALPLLSLTKTLYWVLFLYASILSLVSGVLVIILRNVITAGKLHFVISYLSSLIIGFPLGMWLLNTSAKHAILIWVLYLAASIIATIAIGLLTILIILIILSIALSYSNT